MVGTVTFNQAMLAKDRVFAIRAGAYTSSDIKEASFNYGYISGDTFKPGGTVAGSAKLIFTSIITTFNKLDKIYPEIGLLVGDSYEWVAMGEYFVNDISIDRNRNTTELDLMDGMFKLNQPYVSDLTYPAQIRDVIREICVKTGIELETDNLSLKAIQRHIEAKADKKDITFREVLSQAIQLLGFSAFFNRKGKLEVRGLTESRITVTADNYFLHGLTKSEIQYQIAGITCKKDKETLTVGLRTGRSLELENSFMNQNLLDELYYELKDIKYYPFSLDWQGHLKLDVGQWITLKTNKNETYKVPVLSQSFSFKGGLKSKISADSKARNDTQYSYKGFLTKQIEQMSTQIDAEIQQQLEYANAEFDRKTEEYKKELDDGIEQAKAEAEAYADTIRQELDAEIAQVNQSTQAQSEEHDRQVADILSKTQSVESLANEAKTDAASAITTALQSKDEAIADARAQVATVSQALNTAKSELQTAIASADQKARDSQASATALRNDLNLQASKILEQARAQTALTNRVTTVETLADGTRSTVAELSKTVSKATGDITSITSRTKTVEDTLSQTRTQYEALSQTVNAQTGQIESINRKTADLQSGIDGVTERFESLRIEDNLLLNSSFNANLDQWQGNGVTIVDGKARIIGEFNKTKYIYQSIKSQTANDDVNQVYIASISVKVTNFVAGSRNPYLAIYIDGRKNDSTNTWFGGTYLTTDRLETVNNRGIVQFTTTFKVNVPRSQIKSIVFYIYARDFTGEVEFEKVSLRRGDIDLGWQASPEDLRHEIGTYVRNASENSAELVRRIETADGKAVDAKAFAQQTAEGFRTRLETLETYKNEEGTRASQYLTASRTETAKQIAAERAVIATDYVAKSTYTEDARGTTQRLNEIKSTADTAKQNLATYQNTVDRKLEELTSSTQTLDGKINTASAKVDTVAGQIRTEISEVENKIPTKIGVTNLLEGTSSDWKTIRVTQHNGLIKSYNPQEWALLNIKTGDSVTFSIDVKTTSGKKLRSRISFYGPNTHYYSEAFVVNGEGRLSVTGVVPDGITSVQVFVDANLTATTNTGVTEESCRREKLEKGAIATDWSPAPEDLATEISSVKTTITQTASGVEQLSTSLSATNSKVTTAETKIRQLISDVSSKVSQTDYNALTGRVDSAETAITQNANEISKRLTSTQVDKAITDKGYQTKSDVDNNITGRGYITNSALQPYALSTTVQNLVQETAGSFERQITETRGLIPTEVNQNLFDVVFSDLRATRGASFVQSDDGWIEVTIKNKWSGFHWCYSDDINPSKKQYVVSYEAYLVDTVAETARLESDFGSPDQSTLINKTPKRYTVVLNRPVNIFNYINFVCDSSETGKKFRIRNIKLEEGIVATPYIAPFPTTVLFNAVKDTVDAHKQLIGNGDSISQAIQSANKFERYISSGGDIYRVIETAKGLVTEVSGTNGLKTQVSTLAGSWAVKNLTNSGTVLNQLNLNKDGSVKIDGKLVQITGTTYIQDGVITSAKIEGLDAGKINTGELNAARIKANSIDGSKIVFDQAFLNKMTANKAYLQQLFAKDAFLTAVQAVSISASQITGGLMQATNGAMEVNLNAGQILYYTDQAALKRILTGYPTQFVKFATGTVTGKGNAGVTVIGSNRWNSESSNDGGFVGIRAWNGANIDQIDAVGDTVRLASSTFESADGWTVNTLPGKLGIDAYNSSDRPSSRLSIGDVKLFRTSTSYVSLMDVLHQFNHNFKHLQNITGRGDVILTWDTIK
ncbi:TPA: gp58-like family protein [Streptococcus suis]